MFQNIIIAIFVIFLFVCFTLLGYKISSIKYSKIADGTLRIDSSDPDGPYMFLELDTSLNNITKEEYITLRVDTRSYISQK